MPKAAKDAAVDGPQNSCDIPKEKSRKSNLITLNLLIYPTIYSAYSVCKLH